jgi:hypothetical protein
MFTQKKYIVEKDEASEIKALQKYYRCIPELTIFICFIRHRPRITGGL